MIKKISGATLDVFLFCFLLLILVMPMLVSFNLDPKLYVEEGQNVAGVADTTQTRRLLFRESTINSEQIAVDDTAISNDSYRSTIHIHKGVPINQTISLGTIENPTNEDRTYLVQLFGNTEEIEGFKISAFGEILFDGNELLPAKIKIKQKMSQSISLHISSETPVNYPVSFRFEIQEYSAT